MTMQTIIARFTEASRAHEAIDALLQRKYDAADISYVANDVSGEVAVPGANVRATGGAGLGLLVGLGSFAIPGVGPLLAAGPLAVGLAGAAADLARKDEDWLASGLMEVGIPEREARAYGEAVRREGALVLVAARESSADNITAVLRSSGAVAVDWHLRDPRSSGA